MSEEGVIIHREFCFNVDHYLEASSIAKNDWLEVGSLISLVNESLFVAHVQYLGCDPWVAEYPARTLIVESIHGDQEIEDVWRNRIRLRHLAENNFQGYFSAGEFVKFDLHHEANFQLIFRSSLVWTVGYYRTAERDFELRRAPSAG